MTSSKRPTVSVVIAAYNSERFLEPALESVLGQTDPADEIVVVDDGSTDSTPGILRSYGSVLRVVRQTNSGPSAAYNRGFREARHEYVATCASDDLWEPRKLEWQRNALAAHPEVDVALGHARMFGRKEGEYRKLPWTGVVDSAALFRHAYWGNPFAAPTALVRRSFHGEIGAYREDLPGEDYEFWLRALAAGGRFFYDDRVLVHLRKHETNVTANDLLVWEMGCRIHLEYAPHVTDRAFLRRRLAEDQLGLGRLKLAAGDRGGARRAFWRSVGYRPTRSALRRAIVTSVPRGPRAVRTRRSTAVAMDERQAVERSA